MDLDNLKCGEAALACALLAANGPAAAVSLPLTSTTVSAGAFNEVFTATSNKNTVSAEVEFSGILVDNNPGGVDGQASGQSAARGVFGSRVIADATASATNASTAFGGAGANVAISYYFQITPEIDPTSPFFRARVPLKVSAAVEAFGAYSGDASSFGAGADVSIDGRGILLDLGVRARGGQPFSEDILRDSDSFSQDGLLAYVNSLYLIEKFAGCSVTAEGVLLDFATESVAPGSASCGAFADPIIELDNTTYQQTLADLGRCGGAGQDPCPNISDLYALEFSEAVPLPAAVWLFSSGLLGIISIARRKKAT